MSSKKILWILKLLVVQIDVAVISKGDGFVWIRRKHYFNQELNPHYMSKYFYNAKREKKMTLLLTRNI